MLLMPDPATAFIDPYYTIPTVSLICSVADPVLGEPYGRDPRFVAQKAERYLASTGIADVAYFGPEAEFFVFDHIAYEQREHRAFYEIDSSEGFWNTGASGRRRNLGYKLRQKEGYFPVPPADSMANLRAEMVVDDGVARDHRASSTTTRSPPAARARSTCASSRCCRWPTR